MEYIDPPNMTRNLQTLLLSSSLCPLCNLNVALQVSQSMLMPTIINVDQAPVRDCRGLAGWGVVYCSRKYLDILFSLDRNSTNFGLFVGIEP